MKDLPAAVLQTMICFPVMHMLVFLCYLLHLDLHVDMFDQFRLNKMAVKFAF